MAEVQSRGSGTRGRGGFRGGRGGFRGTRNPSSRQHKPDNEQENIPPALEDQGEVGELLKKYGDNLPLLKEICPGWSDQDLVYALSETDGDVASAFDRISTGSISQWGEVKKKHPKTKEAGAASTDSSSRGRGRGGFEGRGRGRGAERGARGGRGAKSGSTTHTNGTKATGDGWDTPAATTTAADANGGWDTAPAAQASSGWDAAPTNGDAAAPATEEWANDPGKDSLSSLQTEEPKPASGAAPSAAKPGGWAGLFAKPTPAPAPKKSPAAPPAAQPAAPPVEPEPAPAPTIEEPVGHPESIVPPPIEPVDINEDDTSELPSAPHSDTGNELTPSKDALTEHNLEKLPDTSHPPESATQVSTVASTVDPLVPNDTKAAPRPPMSGYHASALKATQGGATRSASFARKVKEQQEAVVMPGNHAIEKSAVQFGMLGLGGDDVDVDDDREEPETRTQLPDDSPAAPRASLPPALPEAQQVATSAPSQALAEAPSTVQHQAAGLPPAPQQTHEPSPQSASAYADQYRYGQGQKPYDPFGQQHPQTTQAPSQEPFSNQVPSQPSTATSQPDYSAYYGRDAAYYYGYGHGQDAQRSGSAFGSSAPDAQAQYATARPQQHGMAQQEAQGSGSNTPAPGLSAQHAQQHSSHAQQGQGHGYPGYGYPNAYSQQYPQYAANYMANVNHRYGANRPMFDDVRRQDSDSYYSSQQQQQYNYGQNPYGNNYKSNMYGQPQQSYSYDQASTPANVSAYGREPGYGRAGSAQPSEAQQTAAGSTGFGGMPDPFGRSSSGFGQNQGLGQQQQHGAHAEDPAKVSGPSPSMQGGRPGSAANSGYQGQQSGLPPPSQHSAQQAFGGYPQYGGNVGGSHQNTHQSTGYGSYGSNTGFGGYGGYGGARGGWNGSYGSGH
ncbi:RNAPII degradation factor [Cladophialophora chaetospira]|uniref:RNAPII degradation factor n=1 Tax=Cladophialophora chaetospira TaxID=386627 RepID=A0AA38XC26_9EURO|nr:RNAPII degradation factor [Cladophialophora chaetospira]